MATGLLKNLLKEVENRAKHVSPSDFVTKMKLEEAMAYLREHYGRSPLNFVQITRNMLETEKHLVEMAEHVWQSDHFFRWLFVDEVFLSFIAGKRYGCIGAVNENRTQRPAHAAVWNPATSHQGMKM